MVRMHLKELAFAMALGTAMVAGAQTPSYPSAAPSANQPAMATEKAPAAKDSDAARACANVAAADKEACLVKENAKSAAKSGSGATSSTTPPKSDSMSTTPPKSDTMGTTPSKKDSTSSGSTGTTPK